MNTLILAYPALVTVLAVAFCYFLCYRVGAARMKHGVLAPNTTGPEEFMRCFRIHQNTTEQMVLFLPAMWLFSIYLSPLWGAILGFVWLIGRVIYVLGYSQAASKRLPGFLISILVLAILLLGSLWGILRIIFLPD